jgi:hypothetical protein
LVTHGAQIIELGRSPELARQLASDEIDQVHMRVKSLEDLLAVFRGWHRGLPFWVRERAVNDKAANFAFPARGLNAARVEPRLLALSRRSARSPTVSAARDPLGATQMGTIG